MHDDGQFKTKVISYVLRILKRRIWSLDTLQINAKSLAEKPVAVEVNFFKRYFSAFLILHNDKSLNKTNHLSVSTVQIFFPQKTRT